MRVAWWVFPFLVLACGAPERRPVEGPVEAWLQQRNRPLLRVSGGRLALAIDAGKAEEIQLDTPEMAAAARRLDWPLELHRRVLLRPRPVLSAEEAEALDRWRREVQAEPGELPKRMAALITEVLSAGTVRREVVVPTLRDLRPLVEAEAAALARLRLAALHDAVRAFWQRLPPEGRVMARVEVVGGSGARAGHWAVQYFERVFGVEGEGSRILYVEQPLATLDELIIDEEAGVDIFEDPTRLRRDLLAEGARLWLDERGPDLSPVPPL